jgi:hypothetical protein
MTLESVSDTAQSLSATLDLNTLIHFHWCTGLSILVIQVLSLIIWTACSLHCPILNGTFPILNGTFPRQLGLLVLMSGVRIPRSAIEWVSSVTRYERPSVSVVYLPDRDRTAIC